MRSSVRRERTGVRFVGYLLSAALVACGSAEDVGDALLLRGFSLVDVESASVRRADVLIVDGTISALTEGAELDASALTSNGRAVREVDGRGRWLIPAFWDLQSAPWGNRSTQPWPGLFQLLGVTEGLRIQLYYGVAHVMASRLARFWAARELSRAAALEIPAAELIYPDLPLCASDEQRSCVPLTRLDQVAPLLDELRGRGVDTVQLSFTRPEESGPGLSPDIFEAALRAAEQRSMRAYVLVDSWQRAEQAIALGARVLCGLPSGTLSEALIQSMHDQGVLFAPALSRGLELSRLLGNHAALSDPFLTASVPSDVLGSFEGGLATERADIWTPDEAAQKAVLDDVLRLARGGVRLLSASDAGATPGTFQGYSTHATQAWLERAGVDAWARLRALTVWPAAFMQRRAGFQVGDPADFVALERDPLTGSEALRSISFLVRGGQYLERDSLAPDVSRQRFVP